LQFYAFFEEYPPRYLVYIWKTPDFKLNWTPSIILRDFVLFYLEGRTSWFRIYSNSAFIARCPRKWHEVLWSVSIKFFTFSLKFWNWNNVFFRSV
jgi:hypothetical protein